LINPTARTLFYRSYRPFCEEVQQKILPRMKY
jgi:hypothetical protein